MGAHGVAGFKVELRGGRGLQDQRRLDQKGPLPARIEIGCGVVGGFKIKGAWIRRTRARQARCEIQCEVVGVAG